MPAVSSVQLVDAILDAVEQSGEAAILTSAVRSHPRKIAVSGPQGPTIGLVEKVVDFFRVVMF